MLQILSSIEECDRAGKHTELLAIRAAWIRASERLRRSIHPNAFSIGGRLR
jgi:hypothetical protein